MRSIADILKSFKLPIAPETSIQLIIEDFFFKTKGKKPQIKISFQGKTIFIKTDLYTKREILLKQKDILEKIKETFPKIPTINLR